MSCPGRAVDEKAPNKRVSEMALSVEEDKLFEFMDIVRWAREARVDPATILTQREALQAIKAGNTSEFRVLHRPGGLNLEFVASRATVGAESVRVNETGSVFGLHDHVTDDDEVRTLKTALTLGYLVVLRPVPLSVDSRAHVEAKIRAERERRTREAYGRDYSFAEQWLHAALPVPNLVKTTLEYLHGSFLGASFSDYVKAGLSHMEIDFGFAMRKENATLSAEYKALFTREWELADRWHTGIMSKCDFLRFHRRLHRVHGIVSWKLDADMLSYIARVLPQNHITFRDLCLYAEEGEEYVQGTEEVPKRLVDKDAGMYDPDETFAATRPVLVPREKSARMQAHWGGNDGFKEYMLRCLRHLDIDYGMARRASTPAPTQRAADQRDLARARGDFERLWIQFDPEKTGYLRNRSIDAFIEAYESRRNIQPFEARFVRTYRDWLATRGAVKFWRAGLRREARKNVRRAELDLLISARAVALEVFNINPR